MQREVVRDQLLQTAIPLTEVQRQDSVQLYLEHLGVKTDLELKRLMLAEALDESELKVRALRFQQWSMLCETRFRNKILSLFLKRKSSLDRVVYSLHWVDDEALAQELFIRLKERECSFEQLFCSLPEQKKEGLPSGKHGPIALEMLPGALAQLLRVSEPGQVWPPREAEGGWVIVQLEETQPAVLNRRLKRELALELGDRWLEECAECERG